jgi:nitrite reductase (NO-forming)
MHEEPHKLLWTWWLTLGVMGLLVIGIIVYPVTSRSPVWGAGAGHASAAAPASSASASAAVPAAASGQTHTAAAGHAAPAVASVARYSAPPQAPIEAVAPPYNPASEVDLVFTMDDRRVIEVAPGTYFEGWTFNGTVPGPIIRVRQGAKVNVTLVNEGRLPHSLDFHSARTPISNYRNVAPGESFTWTYEAKVPGVYMYHCGTAPALQHIGNGMYGVMIVDADPLLAPPDREYVLLQSEFYYGPPQANGVMTGDLDKMQKIAPDVVAFNGHQSQYRDHPLRAEPGELVRFHVVDAGPTMNSAFHIVGEIFEKVYVNGNPAPENIDVGVQTVLVPVGSGATFDVRFGEAGEYLFVSHAFAQAAKGAVGVVRVGQPADGVGVNVDH